VTSETRTTIEASDIKALELECTKCGVRAIWKLEQCENPNFEKCAHCGTKWPFQKGFSYQALTSVITGMQELAKVKNDKEIPFMIRFEIAGVSDRVASEKD
jgi:predicted RNA-binding Zn-ribbon protein involved in translation (DUF1610 family)